MKTYCILMFASTLHYPVAVEYEHLLPSANKASKVWVLSVCDDNFFAESVGILIRWLFFIVNRRSVSPPFPLHFCFPATRFIGNDLTHSGGDGGRQGKKWSAAGRRGRDWREAFFVYMRGQE